MPRKRQDVTDAELMILQRLWDRGPATVRQLTDWLYPGGSFSEYATVKKLLARLEKKGHVTRDASDRAHVFQARTGRNELLRHRLQTLSDELCSGSRMPLLMNLLETQPLTEQELQELHEFLNKQAPHGHEER